MNLFLVTLHDLIPVLVRVKVVEKRSHKNGKTKRLDDVDDEQRLLHREALLMRAFLPAAAADTATAAIAFCLLVGVVADKHLLLTLAEVIVLRDLVVPDGRSCRDCVRVYNEYVN